MLLKPVGYPVTQVPGTEINGKNIDPITGTITAPNGVVYASKGALTTAANASIAAGKSAFGLSR